MAGYLGNVPVPQATMTFDKFTATAGQTSFATSGYTPNFLQVYLNGVHLVNGTDYTATNGSDVVLTSGATSGDVLEVLSFGTFQTGDFVPTSGGTFTGGVTVPSLTSTGAMTGTNLTLSGGVYLGGTGSANLLDDYEVGTFTPTLDYETSGTLSVSYSVQAGNYVKIGNMVFFRAEVRLASFSKGTASGNLLISNLPFTSKLHTFGADQGSTVNTWSAPLPTTSGHFPTGQINSNSTNFALRVARNNDGLGSFPDPDGDSQYKISGYYEIA